MMKTSISSWGSVALIFLTVNIAQGQCQPASTSSKEFVLGFPDFYPYNFDYYNDYIDYYLYLQLYIHAQEFGTTMFNITTGNGDFNYTGTCSPLNPAIVDIPLQYILSFSNLNITWSEKALKVSADQSVSVLTWIDDDYYYTSYSAALVYPACEATSSTPVYTYYVMSTESIYELNTNQLLIAGCQDNTFFSITPSQNITIPSDMQSLDYTGETITAGELRRGLSLHSMETMLVTSHFDLTGTKISSNRPLSIMSGSQCARVPNDVGSCEFLMTHIPPTHQWGRRFLLSPHRSRFAQGYKILAQTDETSVITTCNESAITNYMLNDQQSVVFFTRGDTYCSVESTNVIYMIQYGVGGDYEDDINGDPTINNIPPIEQHVHSVQFTVLSENSYYSIVIKNDNLFKAKIIFDGTVQSISNWKHIYNSIGEIVGYGYTSEVFNDTHTIAHPNSNGVLSVSVYGWSWYRGYSYTAGSSVEETISLSRDATITPTHGSMLGGTVLVIDQRVLRLSSTTRITCMFDDSIAVNGAMVSTREAICISPRLDKFGPVQLSVLIDGQKIKTSSEIFYSQHFSDIADMYMMRKNLAITSGEPVVLNWDIDLLIQSQGQTFSLDIIMHEARVSHDNKVEWTNEVQLASQVDNTGVAEIIVPVLPMISDSDTAHYVVLFQLIVNTSLSNTDRYYTALKQLKSKAGIWSHVLFRKVKDGDDTTICSEWMNSNDSHPTSYEGVDACPCTQAQADLPMSTFTPRTTPGQKKLDTFFHEDSVCYGPKRTIVDSFNGIFKLSQQCCYNANGELIIGNSRAGSVDTQPPHEWENHFSYDLDPFITCCKGSRSSSDDIRKYYVRRPTDTCLTFRQLDPPARARGDPHLLTLDGYQYTFNGK